MLATIEQTRIIRRTLIEALGRLPIYLDCTPAVEPHCFIVVTRFSVQEGRKRYKVNVQLLEVEDIT